MCGSPARRSTRRQNSRSTTREFIGRKVPLTAVYEIAKRITDRYGVDGYVLSRAVIESQTLDPAGAIVRLRIVEGYVDKVVWPRSC